HAFRPAQVRMKTSTAIPAFKTPRLREDPARGRSKFVSGKSMTLGLMHAIGEFLRQQSRELLRAFSRQMRVIDPDFRVVKFGILPAVGEGEQRSWRRLPELRRCLRHDWGDCENGHGAGQPKLRGSSAAGL